MTKYVFLYCFLFFFSELSATHLMGGEFTYKPIGGNVYELTLTVYMDCSGSSSGLGLSNFGATSVSCNKTLGGGLKLKSQKEITYSCPTATTVCNGGTFPGVIEKVYTATVALTANCNDWLFDWPTGGSSCGCMNCVTTLTQLCNAEIYLYATLNNSALPNNSVKFQNKPVTRICTGQTHIINPGAYDPDGDSLVYELVASRRKNGQFDTVTYNSPYSSKYPLSCTGPFTLNSVTGDLTFTPNLIEVTVVSILVKEYRNGVLVGSTVREIQISTYNCTNSAPALNGINGTGIFSATICTGSNFCFSSASSDPDASDNVKVTVDTSSFSSASGATYTAGGGKLDTMGFCWQTQLADSAYNPHLIKVYLQDDACPYLNNKAYTFALYVKSCIPFFGVSATKTNINCNGTGGSATAVVSGGTSPFTFLWSPGGQITSGISGLTAGTYTVIVTDATSATARTVVTISQSSSLLILSATSNGAACNQSNGSASVTVSGGTAPYIYQWSNGATQALVASLQASVYSVTVTDSNGCSQTASTTVNNLNGVTAQIISTTSLSCNGGNNGSAVAGGTGGTSPYSFMWSNGKTSSSVLNLPAGNYSVTVTDASGCTSMQQFAITAPSALTASLTSSSGCGSGNISSTAFGGTSPYSYSWSNGAVVSQISYLTSQIYSVTVTDNNNCTVASSINISSAPTLTASVSGDTTITVGSGVMLNAYGGTSWQWNPSAGLSCSNCQNPFAKPLSTTVYCVTVSDANGCSGTACVTVNVEMNCGLFIPTAFSPEGNNKNDDECVYGTDCFSTILFKIYDRWGGLVFKTNDPRECWDSRFKGIEVDTGIYYYLFEGIDVNGKSAIKKGSITLLR